MIIDLAALVDRVHSAILPTPADAMREPGPELRIGHEFDGAAEPGGAAPMRRDEEVGMQDRSVDDERAGHRDQTAVGPGADDRAEPPDAMAPELDEPTLVARAQDGDLAAFEALVDRYQGPLYRLALRMLTDRTDAEDVVQDSLIAIWRRLPLINDKQAFAGWAYKITINRCLDLIKQRSTRRTDAVAGDDLDRARPSPADGPAQQAQLGAEREALSALLQTLPPRQRACWLLREVHGRSYAEIAGVLSLTDTAVRGQLTRARASLTKGMGSWRPTTGSRRSGGRR